MKMKYFLLVGYAIMCVTNTLTKKAFPAQEPTYVHIINNGLIDLIINNVLIPKKSVDVQAYSVPVHNNELVISLPDQDPKQLAQKIKLLKGDIGNTIKVGGYYNTTEGSYFVSALRSDMIPIIRILQKNIKRSFLPRKL